MTFGVYLGVAFLLSAWSTIKCASFPDGVLDMECRDRFFMIAVDLSFTGEDVTFEAVDGSDAFPVTEQYAARCGYSVVPLQGRMELRASYFSCATVSPDDKMFTFNLNVVATLEGETVTYALNKTCSPALPWSPREVTCEAKYMEVSVMSEITCPSGRIQDDWNDLDLAHGSTTSDWQVSFKKGEDKLPPMSLSDARKQGYVFDLTHGRIVFRTPYGQPESFSTEVNGVPVEVVQATLFSRNGWIFIMVDLVAACSMDEGSFEDSGYIVWKTPEMLYPSLEGAKIRVGMDGELIEPAVAGERGYAVEKHNATVQISVPYNAEGGHRKSFVMGDLYEYYVFNLYVEQILIDDDQLQTRVCLHRTMGSSLLPHPLFTDNQVVVEECVFVLYLGEVPVDVDLAAVSFNGQDFAVPFANTSSYTMAKVVHPNDTHGYALRVPCDDPVVIHEFAKEKTELQHKLDINYTLTVLPENEPFYHWTSVMVLTDITPPVFDAVCSESGISFTLDHEPFDYMWEISVGSAPLTAELAAQHGYTMSNDSQSLQLFAPLFAPGYTYENVTLKRFMGTFEILVQNNETSGVRGSTVKTCSFPTSELIVCSTDGRMTVVADLYQSGDPDRIHLVDRFCGPKEMDDTRALFSLPLNSCGSTVRLGPQYVTYQNEIFYKKHLGVSEAASEDYDERVTVQCMYPLAGLHRLFSKYRFESDTVGVGSILHSMKPTAAPLTPNINSTEALKTTPATRRPPWSPSLALPAAHPTARFVKVYRTPNLFSSYRKGNRASSQAKIDPV